MSFSTPTPKERELAAQLREKDRELLQTKQELEERGKLLLKTKVQRAHNYASASCML